MASLISNSVAVNGVALSQVGASASAPLLVIDVPSAVESTAGGTAIAVVVAAPSGITDASACIAFASGGVALFLIGTTSGEK